MPQSRDDARRSLARRWSRRRVLSSMGMAGLGLGAAALVGCDATPTVAVPTPRATGPATTSTPPTASPTPSIRRGGVWRMTLAADPGSLDPHANVGANAKAAAAPVYSRLLAYESGPGKAPVSFSTVPDAAEFTQAPDAQTFVVRLNPRAKFSVPVNRPMTSADVKYSLDRVLGRGGSNTPTADAQLLSMVQTVETPDERTVTFKLKEPYGAFAQVLAGIRACREAGIKVGLRFTMNRRNVQDLPGIFDLLQAENIPRVCFYNLVYAGRGSTLIAEDLTHAETRQAVDLILDRTRALHDAGFPAEVLTVDNHCDGPYLYLRLLREDPARAEKVLSLLHMNGGNSAGIGIGCVSWDGQVYADQFWRHHPLGNVRERSFGDIWTDTREPLLAALKARKPYLQGRCAGCRWLESCNGNFRVRAEAVTGDLWEPDPACYLRDDEIAPYTL